MSSDALNKGVGTPWGTTRYGQPTTPTAPTYISDPNQYKSFDTTPQFQQGLADINANQQAAVNRAKMRTASTGGNVNLTGRALEGARQGQMNKFMGDVNQASWADKQNQMAKQNAFNQNMYAMLQNQYKTDAELSEGERAQRRGAVGTLFPGMNITELFGGF